MLKKDADSGQPAHASVRPLIRMIPLRDDAPCFRTPFVTYLLLGLNILVFLFEVSLPAQARMNFLFELGVVPTQVTAPLRGVQAGALASFAPLVTSMFLHASWLHVLSNMLALWIFGDNVEDNLGHFAFLLFYLTSGVVASLLHVAFNLSSDVPSVGASGAIAGVMGAYFLLFPSARVLTLVPFILPFFTWLPAWLVLGYWFVVQFLSGAATSIAYSHQTSGGIAFWAHVGGFLTGVTLIKLFGNRPQRYRYHGW